jgi:peptidoglycan-associated lipoprotein
MKKALCLWCLAAALLCFHGCASKPASEPLSQQTSQVTAPAEHGPALEGSARKEREGAITEEDLAKAAERRRAAEEAMKAAGLQDIYFDFDSYAIRSEALPTLQKLALWLSRNQSVKLKVEGYCDERGTTEYNLALGEKRAEAAVDYLRKEGVSAARMKAVSYGKEAPVDPGHTEEAWAKNRRAHFAAQ